MYNYTIDEAMMECGMATTSGLLDALCNSFQDVVLRFQELYQHYQHLRMASDYTHPFVLVSSAKKDIVKSVPVSQHGLVYACCGFVIAWLAVTVQHSIDDGRRT